MSDKINRLLREQHRLMQRLGRDPTVDELAEVLDILPKKVENMIQISKRPLSLEMPTEGEGSVLGEFVEDRDSPPPDETATYNLLKEHIEKVLDSLSPREVKILQLRYGLLDGESHTLQEVGRKMGVTRERIRQVEAQALRRLRVPGIRKQLRDYLGSSNGDSKGERKAGFRFRSQSREVPGKGSVLGHYLNNCLHRARNIEEGIRLHLGAKMRVEKVEEVVDKLSAEERQMLVLLLGLKGERVGTIKAVAKGLGVAQATVVDRFGKAMEKLAELY